YTVTFSAINGTLPYTWSSTAPSGLTFRRSPSPRVTIYPRGALPAGLTLSPSGVLSGVPTATGTVSFTIWVSDSSTTTPQTVSQTFTLTVNPPPTISGGSALPDGIAGVRYSANLSALGGTPPLNWGLTAAGSLPPGLNLFSNGSILGTPTAPGLYSFGVVVTDAWGAMSTSTLT